MNSAELNEHVVVRIRQCEASDDGCSTILDIDTNTGPMRLRVNRPSMQTLIGAASVAPLAQARSGLVESTDIPPIVRFLTAVQRPLEPKADK